jgi:hypothetical protein
METISMVEKPSRNEQLLANKNSYRGNLHAEKLTGKPLTQSKFNG